MKTSAVNIVHTNPVIYFFLYLKNESCISIEGSEMIVAPLQLA